MITMYARVQHVLKQIWRYQGHFTALQKSMILSLAALIMGVTVSWWPFVVYHVTLALAVGMGHHILRGHPRWNLHRYTHKISTVKECLLGGLTVFEEKPIKSKRENRPDTPETELCECLKNIQRDFVKSWYSYVSEDSQFLEDTQDILDDLTLRVVARLRGLDLGKILPKFMLLLRQHVIDYHDSLKHLASQPYYRKKKDRTKEFKKVKSLSESFSRLGKLHIAVKSDNQLERLYLCCVMDSICKILMPAELYACNTAKELIEEIIVCQVLVELVNMFSDPDWLHQVIIRILSDEDPIIIDAAPHNPARPDECEKTTVRQCENLTLLDQGKVAQGKTTPTVALDEDLDPCSAGVLVEEKVTRSAECSPVNLEDNPVKQTDGDCTAFTNESKPEMMLNTPNLEMLGKVSSHDPEIVSESPSENDHMEDSSLNQQMYVSEKLLSKYFKVAGSNVSDVDSEGMHSPQRKLSNDSTKTTEIFHPRGDRFGEDGDPTTAFPDHSSLKPNPFLRGSPPKRLHIERLLLTESATSSTHSEEDPSDRDVDCEPSFFIPSDDEVSLASNSGTYSTGSHPSPEGSVQSTNDDIHIMNTEGKLAVHKQGSSDISPSGSIGNSSQSGDIVQNGKTQYGLPRPPSSESGLATMLANGSVGHSARIHLASGHQPMNTLGALKSNSTAEIPSVQNMRYIPKHHPETSLRKVFSSGMISKDTSGIPTESMLNPSVSLPSVPNALTSATPIGAISLDHSSAERLRPSNGVNIKRRFSEPLIEKDAEGEGVIINPPDFIFININVPAVEKMKDPAGVQLYILYVIQYRAWHQVDDQDQWVGKTSLVRRRYREFVTLQERLEEHPIYKKKMKGVKGPRRWRVFPLSHLESHGLEKRRKSLEDYLQNLIHRDQVGNSLALREFVAYEGDARIAFVKKATEGARIDKVIAKTFSGMFNKISTISAPSRSDELRPKVHSKSKGHSKVESRDVSDGQSLKDLDAVSVEYGFLHSDQMEIQTMENVLTKHIHQTEATSKMEEASDGSSDDEELRDARESDEDEEFKDVIEPSLDPACEEGEDCEQMHDCSLMDAAIPLVSALLDLAVQLGQGRDVWVMHEKVMVTLKVTLGPLLESFLNESVADLTTSERFQHYIHLLRDTLWPGGELVSGTSSVRTEQQKEVTKQQARSCIIQFFPAFLPILVGDEDFKFVVDAGFEVLQHPDLNRHLVFCLLDLALELIFPEVSTQEIQDQLLKISQSKRGC